MTATALLKQVRFVGVEVHAVGNRLRLRPASQLSPKLIDALRAHKPEVLAALRAEQRHESGRVGPWQPAGATARCCPSCGGGLQRDDADNSPCFTCRWSREHLWPQRLQ